jgi:glycosyltransferase 2 family protein
VSAAKKVWSSAWRLALGGLLLLWIFHSIFVNEARGQAERNELVDRAARISSAQWKQLPRTEQWRLGWTYGPPALWHTLRSVDTIALVFSVIVVGVAIVVGIVRWRALLKAAGFQLSFTRTTEISFVAHFFNSMMLGTVGGDVMKAYYAARETHHRKNEAVVTVLVDRVIGLWAMLVFASLMILPNLRLFQATANVPADPLVRQIAALILTMTVGATGFVFMAFRGGVSKRWSSARDWLRRLPKGEFIERLLDACRGYGKAPRALVTAFALSMLVNLLCVTQFWILARGLRLDVSFLALCFIAPSIVCIAALPIAPSGIGVRENLFVHMLAIPAIAVHATPALSLSLLAFAGSLFWSIVGGIVYMTFKQKHHLAEQELTEEAEG